MNPRPLTGGKKYNIFFLQQVYHAHFNRRKMRYWLNFTLTHGPLMKDLISLTTRSCRVKIDPSVILHVSHDLVVVDVFNFFKNCWLFGTSVQQFCGGPGAPVFDLGHIRHFVCRVNSWGCGCSCGLRIAIYKSVDNLEFHDKICL